LQPNCFYCPGAVAPFGPGAVGGVIFPDELAPVDDEAEAEAVSVIT
jgi:hypothetical protein